MKLRFAMTVAGLGLAFTAWAGSARADIASTCGNIDVEANAQCEVQIESTCKLSCTEPKLEVSCAAQLEASCTQMGKCEIDASVDCTGSCDLKGCEAECNVNPGSFDCEGECKAEASGKCDAECKGEAAGSQAHGECVASCKASASAECHGSCMGTPPSANCQAKCQAKCDASCTAQARAHCQVDCQAKGYAQCEGELKAQCEGECTKPEGALFCDGQYIDHGGNLQSCISEIDGWLKAHVDASAQGSAMGECNNGSCQGEAEGSAKASCAMAPGAPAGGLGTALLALTGAAVVARRRRASR